MLDAKSEPYAQRNFGWIVTSLHNALRRVVEEGLCEISIYTNPEGNQGVNATGKFPGAHPSWSLHAAPWFVAEITNYLRTNAST